MGLDRPLKLFLIFAFASVSIAAIRHQWRISAILLNRSSGSKLGRSEFSSSKCPGTQGIRLITHCLGMCPLCCTRLFFASVSSSSSVWKSLCGTSMSSTFLYPICRKYLHCFPPVPVLVQQICLVLLFCRRTTWRSETCADQLEDALDFQPISTILSRQLSRWSRQFDRQYESQCAYLMRIHDVQHLQCRLHTKRCIESDLPEIHIHGHSVIEGLCMFHLTHLHHETTSSTDQQMHVQGFCGFSQCPIATLMAHLSTFSILFVTKHSEFYSSILHHVSLSPHTSDDENLR